MSNISVTIDSKKFDSWTRSAPAQIERALTAIIRKSTYLVERYAKIESPVDSGRLRASIFNIVSTTSASVSTNTNYAQFVHDGTRYITPNPFMLRAAEQLENELDGIVDSELKVLD